ncbi:TetR/AcrR family transcriptional regulator [Cellulomonas carbonis]|uniref:HTH tetR-type domain-containing protein n=2 Tax=Cellulomonas carbonis TaxID=1386092 RepID=A0A0A0BW70_9CELL|nr:TetR/AcrR family transcriptional regulator [Cellulomonas carbonis]KGM12200.1 hypothetical protein N868_00820 [Cellulomonas carbonis T26]GGB96352.1 hypothetical protein GCM10010972_06320 [Cellulomonas carbonis]
MSPDDRRDAVLAATVPLLLDRGLAVTTRELAEAACVAEGTLFRVFPDKASLVRAAIERALDPAPLVAALGGVPRAQGASDPSTLVRVVVGILLDRAREVSGLVSLVHAMDPGAPHPHPRPAGRDHVEAVVTAVAELLEPVGGRLRREPAVCARLLVGLVLAVVGPLGRGSDLDADDLTELFCAGAVREGESC